MRLWARSVANVGDWHTDWMLPVVGCQWSMSVGCRTVQWEMVGRCGTEWGGCLPEQVGKGGALGCW